MEKTFQLNFRKIEKEEIQDSLDLVHRVFDEFEAPFYPQKGVQSFYNFIRVDNILPQYLNDSLYFYGCFVDDTIVGMIAVRNFIHISLLFVDKHYHKQGIAKHLFNDTIDYCKLHNPSLKNITVNSSPYAVEVYHRLGFVDTSSAQTVDGITYTPMKMVI